MIGAVFVSKRAFVSEDASWNGARGRARVSRVSSSDTKLSSVLSRLAVEKSLKAVYADVQGIRLSAPDKHWSSAGKYVTAGFVGAMVES